MEKSFLQLQHSLPQNFCHFFHSVLFGTKGNMTIHQSTDSAKFLNYAIRHCVIFVSASECEFDVLSCRYMVVPESRDTQRQQTGTILVSVLNRLPLCQCLVRILDIQV